MLGPRPTPPVVQRDGFQLRQGHFTRINGGIGRVSGSRLKELFDPSSLQLEQDRIEAERTAQQLFTKKFFSAQLSHYGLRHPRNIKNPNSRHFRELLREAVLNGKCDQVPEQVTNLKHAMELELEPIHQQWVIEVEAWEATKRQEEEGALHNKSPGEKASMDINWFMDYYLLTNGKPDRYKTPEPLALHGYSGLGRDICALVDRVPGLAWARGGAQFRTTLCIGWGHKAVQALAEKLTVDAWATKRKREKTDRENAMNAHQDYLSQSNQGSLSRGRAARAGNQPPQMSFDLGQCRGSYVVESNTLFGAWQEMVDEVGCGSTAIRPVFTLDIRESKVAGILIGAVDFATFQGAMILSDSKRKLRDLLRSEGEADEFSDRDYDGEYGTEAEEDEGDDKTDETDETDDADDDADDENYETHPPHKRQRTIPSTSRRIFFRTRGSDAGEYYSDPQPGCLDFSNDGYASFCGQCSLAEEVGVDLKGYKVSDVPAPAKRGGAFEWPL